MVHTNGTSTTTGHERRPIEILLVDDSPGDVRLMIEAFKEGQVANRMSVAKDGVEALSYLRREDGFDSATRPDIIVLDLNLPRMDGRELLAEIKADDDLKRIPVVILTTSNSDQDIDRAYSLNANCFVTKPVDLDRFIDVVKSIEAFWLSIVTLPAA